MTAVENEKSTVTVTLNGVEIEANPGELLIDAAERHGTYIPVLLPLAHEAGRHVPDVPGRGRLGPWSGIAAELHDPGGRGHDRRHRVRGHQEGSGWCARVPAHQPPARLPGVRQGWRMPVAGSDRGLRPSESRFVEEKRHYEKPIPISDTVYLDRERCILCDRCTRFADDVAGDTLIHFMDRGNSTQVNTFPDEPFASYFSGNTVQICPVGALTAKPYRFKARPWDLEETISTAWIDSVGSRVTVQSSRNQVLRLLGVDADSVNWGWLSDKERFGFEALNSEDRLTAPMVRVDDRLEATGWAPLSLRPPTPCVMPTRPASA